MDTTAPIIRTHRTAVFAALALVAALLLALVNPAGAQARSAIPPRTATEISYARAIEKLLNSERVAHHLKPVTMRASLINSARGHDLTMSHADTMSHQLRGEPALGSRLDEVGYHWIWAGENIGWNSDMSEAGVLMLQKEMYNELPPENGHRLNILSPHYTNLGVDVYLDAAHHKVWLTVDFGRL